MRKCIYSMMVSLDGFIEGPGQDLSWHLIDEELHRFVNDRARALDAFLFGRRMYELLAEFWPTADADPSNPDFVIEYSRIWKSMPKLVFSQTLDHVAGNASLVREDVAATVKRLKAQPGKDFCISGATITASLIQKNLVDEFQLYLHPVVLGHGTPMFPSSNQVRTLELIESQSYRFASGVVFLCYQRPKEG
jgi:dihydrofolate reductase